MCNLLLDDKITTSYKMSMKQITYTSDARKTLRRIPANESAKIIAKLEQYAEDPASLANNVITMKGADTLRMRVGSWRVIFTEDMEVIEVIKVSPRGGAYMD